MHINAAVEAEFLSSIIKSKITLESGVLEHLDPGYFAVGAYKWLAKKLKDRDWKPVEWDYVDQLLTESITDEEKHTLFRDQIWHLFQRELTFTEDAEKKFKTYIAYSVMKATTKNAFDGFNRTSRIDYMLNDFAEAQKKASEIIREESFPIVDWAGNYTSRAQRRIAERDNPDINPVFKMGIKGLDEQFDIRSKSIVDIIAPLKRGKSIVLNHIGFASVLQGFNVLHLIYENTIELTCDRYDALFGQLNYDRVRTMALNQEEKDQLDVFFDRVNNWDARLKIMKCTPKSTKLSEVEEYLITLKAQGWIPDVIVIDYLNIVAPNVPHREERLQQGQIVWDMKHLADTFDVPIFTASQSNMESVSAERLSEKHRGKSIDISQGVNLSIALNQTPEEKAEGLMILSPMFSRESEITNPEVVVNTDFSKMMITRDVSYLWEIAKLNDTC